MSVICTVDHKNNKEAKLYIDTGTYNRVLYCFIISLMSDCNILPTLTAEQRSTKTKENEIKKRKVYI